MRTLVHVLGDHKCSQPFPLHSIIEALIACYFCVAGGHHLLIADQWTLTLTLSQARWATMVTVTNMSLQDNLEYP